MLAHHVASLNHSELSARLVPSGELVPLNEWSREPTSACAAAGAPTAHNTISVTSRPATPWRRRTALSFSKRRRRHFQTPKPGSTSGLYVRLGRRWGSGQSLWPGDQQPAHEQTVRHCHADDGARQSNPAPERETNHGDERDVRRIARA